MKRNLILCAATAIALSSCSKKNDGGGDDSANSWTFGSTTFKAATIVYLTPGGPSNLSATASGSTGSNGNFLIFEFPTAPTTSGQMLITNSNDNNTVLVSVSKLENTTTTFYANDITTTKANVTMSNGKLSAKFDGKIWLHNLSNFNDSAELSVGTITQQ